MWLKSVFLLFVFFVSTSAINVNENDKLFEISKNIEIFVNTYKSLNEAYVDEIDPATLMRIGIDAMVNSLDPYTNFISESQIESYRILDDAKYEGIGATFDVIDNIPTITSIYNNSPATEAGLTPGDQIISINSLDPKGKSKDEIESIIRGLPGTTLALSIMKPNSKTVENISIVRGEWKVSNVPYSGIVRDGIGYINLSTFTQDATKNIKDAIKELKKEDNNLKGLILDLRNNGGGLLREAISISNIFIPKGEEIVTTKGKIKSNDQAYKTMELPVDLDIPLAVLINKRSASASEIVSGVIQDLDRGVIIGQRSFGKGLVQNTQDIGYNNRLKLTISKYYIPSRRCIQGVEYENGEPVDIPDDKRTKFKTRNGRTVLDGGGVSPDVKTEINTLSPFTQSLIDNHMIFYFVNDFVSKNDSIVSPDEYKFNDYEQFVNFVKAKNYDFKYKSETQLEELKKLFKSDELDAVTANELESLSNKIKTAKQKDFYTSHEIEIVDQLEQEIVSRYYFENGKIRKTLSQDKEINKAIEILTNKEEYNKILNNIKN
jgi:carboxyl-terminal processing protease